MRKVFFIVNPAAAAGGARKRWERLVPELHRRDLRFDWEYTTGPYTAPGMAARAVEKGYDAVVAVGGDGTAYEVLNGLIHRDQALDRRVSLAVLPAGIGCDFARTAGIRADVESLARLLREGDPRPIDVGRAEFTGHRGESLVRYFLNMAGTGLGAETASLVNRSRRFFRGLSFYWAAVVSILYFGDRSMGVHMDNREYWEARHTLLALGNGKYFGGGMKICPHAEVNDGWLDVVGILSTTRRDLISGIPLLYRGDHLGHWRVWQGRAKKIALVPSSGQTSLISLDGELPGRLEAWVTLLPGALDLLF